MATASEVTEMTVDIVSAHVSQNPDDDAELPGLVQSVHATIAGLCHGGIAPPAASRVSSAPIRDSMSYALPRRAEDGGRLKSPRRRLRTTFRPSPKRCRAKRGLSADDPRAAGGADFYVRRRAQERPDGRWRAQGAGSSIGSAR